MIRLNPIIGKGLAAVLAICLGSMSLLAQGHASPGSAPAASTPNSPNTQSGQGSQDTAPVNPGMVDPARGPLEPVPPSQEKPEQGTSSSGSTEPAPQNGNERPLGTAIGEKGQTAGGPASSPAGAAIAPAKQHQTRSLLIKLGAIAGAGLAIGTVVALSRGTPSNPPGAK